MPKNRKIKGLMNELFSNIEQIKRGYDIDKANEIIGVNCLLANIEVMDEMPKSEIFKKDFFEVNDYEISEDYSEKCELGREEAEYLDINYTKPISLSKKFLWKSIKKLNHLLKRFTNPNNKFNDKFFTISAKRLEEKLLTLSLDGGMDLINQNGIYSFYIGVKEGYITYEEFGRKVENLVKNYIKLINSKQD
jgi:hypothetical protein